MSINAQFYRYSRKWGFAAIRQSEVLAGAGTRGDGSHGRDSPLGPRRPAGAPVRSSQATRFYRQPEVWHGSFSQYSTHGAASGGGGGLAIQSSFTAGLVFARRPHPDDRQLERRVAWLGRHAQPQRI